MGYFSIITAPLRKVFRKPHLLPECLEYGWGLQYSEGHRVLSVTQVPALWWAFRGISFSHGKAGFLPIKFTLFHGDERQY